MVSLNFLVEEISIQHFLKCLKRGAGDNFTFFKKENMNYVREECFRVDRGGDCG
jgi:hypothetical protein